MDPLNQLVYYRIDLPDEPRVFKMDTDELKDSAPAAAEAKEEGEQSDMDVEDGPAALLDVRFSFAMLLALR